MSAGEDDRYSHITVAHAHDPNSDPMASSTAVDATSSDPVDANMTLSDAGNEPTLVRNDYEDSGELSKYHTNVNYSH